MINSQEQGNILELEKKLDYSFKNQALIKEALSHPSLKQLDEPQDHKDYERFELLGDAILGFLIVEILFYKFQDLDEGNIAKFKSFLVCKETLCKVAQRINLADYIIMTIGEEKSGGRTNPNNIENTMEAILAAVYLDSGIASVRSIVLKLWEDEIRTVSFKDLDPKTHLQEWSQANGHGMPIYEVTDKEGPVHAPNFTVTAHVGVVVRQGYGGSIKLAEKDAARKLLAKLDAK